MFSLHVWDSKKNFSKIQQESEIMERTENLEKSIKEISQQIKGLSEQMEILLELNRKQWIQLNNRIAQRQSRKSVLRGKNITEKQEKKYSDAKKKKKYGKIN